MKRNKSNASDLLAGSIGLNLDPGTDCPTVHYLHCSLLTDLVPFEASRAREEEDKTYVKWEKAKVAGFQVSLLVLLSDWR